MIIKHKNYNIAEFSAGKEKFYRAEIKIKGVWLMSKNFYKTILEAGDEARKIVYSN
ncbi:MAG: hypothetical protein ACOC5T_03470 [Elusimicrobiota bacterium]